MAERDLQLPQWWSGNGVSELLTPVGGVVPVLGAGVSRGAGLPDSGQLAGWLVDNAPMTETPPDRTVLFPVVDAVDPTRMPASELRRMIASHIESFTLRPTPFLHELVHLPSRFIVTFNYDDLVGFTAEQQGLKVSRLSALDRDDRRKAHRHLTAEEGGAPPELTVLHLHGHARAPETLVLDDTSYNELARLPEVTEIVFTLAHFRSLAFVGTTLDEVYLLSMLQKQVNTAFHVVLCREDAVAELTTGRAALSPRQHLRVVGYPDHRDLIVLPRWLSAPQLPRGTQAPAGTLDPDAVPDAGDYVASEFDDRAATATTTATTVSEQDIRDGQRTVVLGVAGTGKTHLLSWLAANRPSRAARGADPPGGRAGSARAAGGQRASRPASRAGRCSYSSSAAMSPGAPAGWRNHARLSHKSRARRTRPFRGY